MAIGPYVCGSWHITKPKKNEKIIKCSPLKSPPFFKIMIFPQKIRVLLCIYCSKLQNNTFLVDFQPKILTSKWS
jgi:hypothetical protein